MELDHIESLITLIEKDTGASELCKEEPDEDAVGWDGNGNPLPMTFGHIRRARQQFETLKASQ